DWVVIPSLALVRILAPFAPRLPVNALGPAYPRFLHRRHGGEWDFEPRYKLLDTFLARAGFLRAVLSLQELVGKGLDIRVPTLVAISGRAGHPTRPTPEDLASSDVVLNPDHIRALAPQLGRDVEVMEFPGGVHDLSLSPSPVREHYTATVVAWALAH
ncbi:MAG: alpha/beta hydrolase, partial [Actinomycetes bacterium]|nr:alpha/beta hydrolase [Actinomycetes bacterium]MDX5400735.1 alpha/beta hydrolase [Actinomycetes bacterium]